MLPEDFYYLGKITKVFGLKGEVVVCLDTDEPEKYHQMESVFLLIGEEPVPFLVESVKVKNRSQLIVKFRDMDPEEAGSYVDTVLCLPLSSLPPLEGNKFYYHEIIGFQMTDEKAGPIGVCEEVLEYPHQASFRVVSGEREVLVPIVDAFIRQVDRISRTIHLSLPEGLLEIYEEG